MAVAMGFPATIGRAAVRWWLAAGWPAGAAAWGAGGGGRGPVQPYPEPLVRLVGLGAEPFQGEGGLSVVEQGNGVEGGAVAGSASGRDAELSEDGEPAVPGGLVAAQAVDHRDRGG